MLKLCAMVQSFEFSLTVRLRRPCGLLIGIRSCRVEALKKPPTRTNTR